MAEHSHPEYFERLCAWLIHKGGSIGIGGTFRSDGTQPGLPGFAPEGRSFHQNQEYSDGYIGATAVDLVAPDGPDANHSHDGVSWAMTIPQGTPQAKVWGLHCNVGTPPTGEPWHMQPTEIDGWLSWKNNGSPAPVAGYPYPGRTDRPTQEDDVVDVEWVWTHRDSDKPGAFWVRDGSVVHLDGPMRDHLLRLGVPHHVSDNDSVWESYRATAQGL